MHKEVAGGAPQGAQKKNGNQQNTQNPMFKTESNLGFLNKTFTDLLDSLQQQTTTSSGGQEQTQVQQKKQQANLTLIKS